MAKHYPINLTIEGRRVIVVGGGEVARRKVQALMVAGADIVVVAPDVHKMLKADDRIEVRERAFRDTDLHGMFVVIVATDDPVINRTVALDAMDMGCLVNVVDCPALSNFIVPAVCRRGDLSISISTGGASPSLARRIREKLEEQFGEEYDEFLSVMGEIRAEVIETVPDATRRMQVFRELTDEKWLDVLREKGREGLRAAMLEFARK